IVGEIRGAEGYTMFAAMNTGHRGVMGTVHANSAKETIVRLNSPPISVPTSMLSSLNLILMQNRIHDRRKGTIRRVTEVAELIPSQELGMPELQVLYRWDPVMDVLQSTGAESFYLQEMCKFSGMNRTDVEKELALRTAILEGLIKKGLRNVNDVCAVTQNYVNKKKLLV
ncbi:MAG TPA: ATPase, T2SS/T4P/T4SS family, partial [Candidatus Norongarragalinales archaeon]|nr:ATPase, T2SS/T4P/T4SS family [Candidatus Norongarragalinales archaeon]